MTTNERLVAVAALVGSLAAFAFCIWLLIKLGTWIVVQFYGDRLGIKQRHVFANPEPQEPTEVEPTRDEPTEEAPAQDEPTAETDPS